MELEKYLKDQIEETRKLAEQQVVFHDKRAASVYNGMMYAYRDLLEKIKSGEFINKEQ